MTYSIGLETFAETYPEIERLYRMHYAEMQARLLTEGVQIGPYAPRLDRYEASGREGWLLTFIVRCDGLAVGYSNVYLTNDMHNGEFIAQEDTVYVEPGHRNGIGRKLTLFILETLRSKGVIRASITTATDNRVGKLLKRLGFRHTAEVMTFTF